MVLRHHNEAESLNAVQKLDWEWKMNELSTGKNESAGSFASVDDLYVPTVRVSDDFALSTSQKMRAIINNTYIMATFKKHWNTFISDSDPIRIRQSELIRNGGFKGFS